MNVANESTRYDHVRNSCKDWVWSKMCGKHIWMWSKTKTCIKMWYSNFRTCLGLVVLQYWIWKGIWWPVDLSYYEIYVNNINHGCLWCNILLSTKGWWLEKLRFKHRSGHCTMDVFLLRFNIMYLLNNGLELKSWQDASSFVEWSPSSELCNSLQNKLFIVVLLLH